jgi:DNA replication protein DnaC
MTQPTPTVSPELKVLMRRLKLGQLVTTLPERLALARNHDLTHSEFLEQLFSDEVQRRDAASAGLRARAAKLDPHMVLEAWDEEAKITYDRGIWSELVTLRFVEQARNAFILGPVGVGKTFLASVHFERSDRLHKRLKAARLDASYDQEMRKLIGVDLLLIDDFALQPLDMLETADIYEICVERHHSKSTVLTSNRDPLNGWPPWPTRSSPSPPSTGSRARRGSWSLKASPTAKMRNRPSGPTLPGHLRQRVGTEVLDTENHLRDHRHSRSKRTRRSPMLLAKRWSLKTGKRQMPQPPSSHIHNPRARRLSMISRTSSACISTF